MSQDAMKVLNTIKEEDITQLDVRLKDESFFNGFMELMGIVPEMEVLF